jgi:[acyl-carrier-protein] S-malonyltransferase
MQDAMPAGEGALAAIVGLEDEDVVALCKQATVDDQVLAPANYNSPGQVVISGHKQAVERAVILAKEAGARLAKLLPVSVPSHCSLMKPAAEKLKKQLATLSIQTPNIPVLSNVDVTLYPDADSIRDGFVRQLYMPVRWVETMLFFNQQGLSHLVECGPGKVLTGLNKRILPLMQLTHTADLVNLQDLLKE